ncbi:hypothetical protein ES332_D07G181600v1 [Gossypium tomentosum]|uniref:PPM-type phosphatase domain-containing protein n=2 Tax=Gossypium TaxID=3633 RepID=A0A5D2K831_GOSTO|nr:hypothetical protein ES332_D07G181600v1 [Gossypium tomentosum]
MENPATSNKSDNQLQQTLLRFILRLLPVKNGRANGILSKLVAVPEISIARLTPSHLFFVVASDGVFEFLSSQTVVNMAAAYKDPSDACAAIAGDSYKCWLELENRTDDITIIIVQIKGPSNSGVGTTDSEVHSRPCQIGGSMNQSTAIVPPLMHQRPLESDVG